MLLKGTRGLSSKEVSGGVNPGRLLRGGMWLLDPAGTVLPSSVRSHAGSFNDSNPFRLQMSQELVLFS